LFRDGLSVVVPLVSLHLIDWKCCANSPWKCAMENPPSLNQTISPFLRLLVDIARGEVDFAVVGGIAICLNDYVRLTTDADIIITEKSENVRRLLDVLRRWGEGWARELAPEEFVPQEGSIRVTEDFDLDIFTRLRGRSLDDVRSPATSAFCHRRGSRYSIPFPGGSDLLQEGFLARQGQAGRAGDAGSAQTRRRQVIAPWTPNSTASSRPPT
jgi:hypothetical protein